MLPGDPATEKTFGLVTADFLVDLMTALSARVERRRKDLADLARLKAAAHGH